MIWIDVSWGGLAAGSAISMADVDFTEPAPLAPGFAP
jgi:hypothetical protein